MNTPIEILKKYWKYSQFKPTQEAVIKSVLASKNTLALLPTGAGKSVCYQLPTLLLDGVCIVVSPLIALMQDQVFSLQKKGIKAIALTSDLNNENLITAFDNLKFGGYKFLYLSPEKLQSDLVQEKLSELNVSLIAIDEAHCISEWGHDFRPSYLRIHKILEIHPKATVIALTATATKPVLNDIQKQLKISNFTVFNSSFYRNNISYSILQKENVYATLLQQISTVKESIIVYVGTRKATKEISKYLNENNYKSNFYHGGLTFEEKQAVLNNWLANNVNIIVATNAFGMGIDKPDVRLVIHLNIPNSIENYIQEAGRAGRDGN
ncbi:MAG TPA: RecQ family ATP-dependent DNA helicase, partial [Flavobacteriaceae bacterium]|nr:RecQ family ATP-dependent DNA helicase [Flavobacteriaceae bacterium]